MTVDRRAWPKGKFEAPGQSLGFLLWQATNHWQRKIRMCLAPFELTHVQFVLLAGLCWLEQDERHIHITQKLLADHCATDPMMTSEILRTLERAKFVERLAHPDDGRAWRLVLTEIGFQKLKAALSAVETADAAYFAELGSQQPDFAHSLRRLAAR
jgi:DNA-binding MarR family transcriptional regulator